jgi:hypothetical protein
MFSLVGFNSFVDSAEILFALRFLLGLKLGRRGGILSQGSAAIQHDSQRKCAGDRNFIEHQQSHCGMQVSQLEVVLVSSGNAKNAQKKL